jgi:uncharacterized protein YxjI
LQFNVFKVQQGKEVLVASVKKESSFANAAAFVNAQHNAQSYFVTLKPGADAAFVVGLATLIDEIYHDKN